VTLAGNASVPLIAPLRARSRPLSDSRCELMPTIFQEFANAELNVSYPSVFLSLHDSRIMTSPDHAPDTACANNP